MFFRSLRAPSLGAVALVAAGAAMSGTASDAEAAFAMRLTSGASSITVMDGPGGDGVLDGFVNYTGALGGFVMNFTGGLSSPPLAPPVPHLDLATQNVSGGPSSITIELSETGLSNTGTHWFNTVWSVATRGTASLKVFVNADDSLFNDSGTGTQVADLTAGSPGGFFTTRGLAATDSSYAVTLAWTIVHTNAGQVTSGNAEFQIPEPGSLALFGIGLLGLGGLVLRRQRSEARLAA